MCFKLIFPHYILASYIQLKLTIRKIDFHKLYISVFYERDGESKGGREGEREKENKCSSLTEFCSDPLCSTAMQLSCVSYVPRPVFLIAVQTVVYVLGSRTSGDWLPSPSSRGVQTCTRSVFPQCAREEGLVETTTVSDQGLVLWGYGEGCTACHLAVECLRNMVSLLVLSKSLNLTI